MKLDRKIIPFMRLVPVEAQAQTEAQRRAAILSCPEAQGAMAACAIYLADNTALAVTEAIAVLAAGVSTYDKAQADALTATVAKRRLLQRAVEILTSPAASHDIELAKWLTLETTVAPHVAIEVMVRTHAADSANV